MAEVLDAGCDKLCGRFVVVSAECVLFRQRNQFSCCVGGHYSTLLNKIIMFLILGIRLNIFKVYCLQNCILINTKLCSHIAYFNSEMFK